MKPGQVYSDLCHQNCWHKSLWTWVRRLDQGRGVDLADTAVTEPVPFLDLICPPIVTLFSNPTPFCLSLPGYLGQQNVALCIVGEVL